MTIRARAEYGVSMRDNTAAAFDSIKRNLGTTTKLLAGLGFVAGAGAFAGMANDVRDFADEVQKLSLRMNESAENISRMQVLASRSALGFSEMAQYLTKANARIVDSARGQGKAGEAIARLGLDVQKFSRLGPVEQLVLLAEAFERVDESARKNIAADIFGNAGIKMLQALSGGREAVLNSLAASDQAGVTISQNTADNFAKANDSMDDFGRRLEGIGVQFITPFSEDYAEFTEKLANDGPTAISKFIAAAKGSAASIFGSISNSLGFDQLEKGFQSAGEKAEKEFKDAGKSVEDFREQVEKDVESTTFDNVFNVSIQRDQFQRDLNKIKQDYDRAYKEIADISVDAGGSELNLLKQQYEAVRIVIDNIGDSMKESFDFGFVDKQLADLRANYTRMASETGRLMAGIDFSPVVEAATGKTKNQLDDLRKLLAFTEEYIFKEKDTLLDERLQGQFRQVNLSRFSLENAGAKPMRTEDPQLKTTNQHLKNLIRLVDRKQAYQEIAAL